MKNGESRYTRTALKFLAVYAALIFVLIIFNLFPIHGEDGVYDRTIRLHVLANSDSAEDQALKLKVRDEVLKTVNLFITDCTDKDSAYDTVCDKISDIRNAAQNAVYANGYNYNVDVEFGQENYPTREYEDVRLPAGNYTSLRVKIGNAEGKNWWCVLFPSLCTDSSKAKEKLASAGFTPSQIRVLTETDGKYVIRFKLLEWFESIINVS